MTDPGKPETPLPEATAGSLLRQAREKQGLHIAMLAASIKVSPRKLEALEADRHGELPDAAFARALAQTVCRTLKVDPGPVLALLPRPDGRRLDQVAEGINAPFRDRDTPSVVSEWTTWLRPAIVLPLLLALAALVVWLLPERGFGPARGPGAASAPASGAPPAGAVAPAANEGVVRETVAPNVAPNVAPAVPVPEPAASAPPAPASVAEVVPVAPASTLQIRASAPSWVEVLDGNGKPLVSRIVESGETVDLDGPLPLRVRVGNAAATQLLFRGQAVDLAPATRENVARLELR